MVSLTELSVVDIEPDFKICSPTGAPALFPDSVKGNVDTIVGANSTVASVLLVKYALTPVLGKEVVTSVAVIT